MKKLTVAVVFCVLGSGCLTVSQHFKKNGLSRAAFDLGCTESELQVTNLGGDVDYSAATMGVVGCGKKATYVMVDNAWVLNGKAEAK